MYTLLRLLIYLAFISLGLPDSLLGSAWPVMHKAFQFPAVLCGSGTYDYFPEEPSVPV